MEAAIPFRRRRDLGDILNATFAFLRQNIRMLAKSQLFIVGPAWLLMAVVSVWLQFALADFDPVAPDFGVIGEFLVIYLGLIGLVLLSTVLEVLVIYGFATIYQERGGPAGIEVDDVWRFVKAQFWPVLLVSLLFGALFFVGLVVVIIPCLGVLAYFAAAVYAGVLYAIGTAALVREHLGVGAVIGRARALVRDRFWQTFGVLFVAWLLAGILGMLFSMPAYIIGFMMGLHGFGDDPVSGSMGLRVLFVAVTVLGSLFSLLLYPIPFLSTAFQYYNLVEEKERVGLMERIDALHGPAPGPTDGPAPVEGDA